MDANESPDPNCNCDSVVDDHKVWCNALDDTNKWKDIKLPENMLSEVSPNHYARWKIEPITFIMVNNIPFAEGNAIKYIMRHDAKNGVKDIDKAIRYLEMIKESTYNES